MGKKGADSLRSGRARQMYRMTNISNLVVSVDWQPGACAHSQALRYTCAKNLCVLLCVRTAARRSICTGPDAEHLKGVGCAAGRRSAVTEADEVESDSTMAVDVPSDPWEKAWDATMESSAAARVKGVQSLCKLLQAGYCIDVITEQCAHTLRLPRHQWCVDIIGSGNALATCREGRFVDLAESTFSCKRPDKALEAAVCQMISLVFLTLGRDCLSAYDSLFELIQVGLLKPSPRIPECTT